MYWFIFNFWILKNVFVQAQSSGKFSNDELLSLKREFQHHKDKIHEYNILMDTVSRTEGESCNRTAFKDITSS